MTIVGSAFIEVKPDTANFQSELSAQLAGATQEIVVPVGPEPGIADEVDAELDSITPGDITVPLGPEEGFAAAVDAEVESANPAAIQVPVVPDAQGFQQAATESFPAAGMAAGGAFSQGFGTAALAGAKKLAAPLAGALVIKAGLDELIAQEEVIATTEQLIRTTGGAANVTSEEIGGLADSLQDVAAVDSELIQQGANVLLTFKNVRNEVGQGNAVFDRTVVAALDVARVMKTDVTSGLLQLGKAVNDPIKGVTALARAGIQFTEQQKEQIKTLVESGHLLEAQKVVLAEVEGQVGGTAKAYGETLGADVDRAKIAFEDIAGSLVRIVAPALKLVDDLLAPVADGIDFVTSAIADPETISEGFAKKVPDALRTLDKQLAAGTITAKEHADALNLVETQMREIFIATGDSTALDVFYEATGRMPPVLGLVEAAAKGVGSALADATPDVEAIAKAHEEAADKARRHLAAELAMLDGFVGLRSAQLDAKSSSDDLAAARAELTDVLQNEGRGTREYHDALRAVREAEIDALISQSNLTGGVLKYVQELSGKAAPSQREVNKLVREYAGRADLSKRQTDRLIDSVSNLIERESQLPTAKTINHSAPGLSTLLDQYSRWLDLSTRLEASLDRTVDNLGKI